MKRIISVLVLSIVSTTLFGQTTTSQVANNNSYSVSPVFIKNPELGKYPVAKPLGLKMRNTARVLTIVGSALIAGGAILYSTADEKYYTSTYSSNTGTVSKGDPQAGFGFVMMATGVGLVVPGIIFWSKGSKKYKSHLEHQGQAASIHIKGNGLALRYRF